MRRRIILISLLALAAGAPAARAANEDHPIDRPQPATPLGAQATQGDSAFAIRLTSNNLIEMTLTNYGFMGNNFVSRASSLVYPKGATDLNGNPVAYEHMVRGGLWFGANARDANGLFTGVVTATTDGNQGSSSNAATEWTPRGKSVESLSNLPTSPVYSDQAVSEEDLISEFDDRVVRRAAQNAETHRPMGIRVKQTSYSWAFSDYQNIIFFHYEFTNTGPVMTDAWVGLYTEFASGNKTVYTSRSIWPPSSTGSIVGGWFSKKWLGYDDSLHLYREHYCASQPIPDGCNLALAPYWIGLRVLGARGLAEDTTARNITFQAWNWDPNSAARDQDLERYAVLSNPVSTPILGDSLLPGTGDPVALQGIGPFPVIYKDSTITVDFALVGGLTIEELQENSRTAQRAFNRGYIIPSPPPSPRHTVVARDGELDFYWDNSPEFATDPTSPNTHDFEGYRLYVGDAPLQMRMLAQYDSNVAPGDTSGFNTGFAAVKLAKPVVINGVTYQYRYTLRNVRDGFKYYTAVTAYDLGNTETESLESGRNQNLTLAVPGPAPGERPTGGVTVFPNPYRVEARWDQLRGVRDHYLWFANLPSKCTLRIYTIAGDEVFSVKFDGSTYRGEGTRGLYDPKEPSAPNPPQLSGSSYAWDMISSEGQAIATGLYLYSVEDESGNRQVGKFLIVKSDREEF